MKKLPFKMLLLMTCLLLAACGNEPSKSTAAQETEAKASETKQAGMSEKDKQSILDEKIEQLNSEETYTSTAGGYNHLQVVQFLPTEIAQILTITDREGKNVVEVHNYNKETENWDIVYENREYDNYDGFERLYILAKGPLIEGSELEHAIIGNQSGSGGYLNFLVLGEDEGEVAVQMNKMYTNNQYQGSISIQDYEMVISSFDNSELARFPLDGAATPAAGDENLQVVLSIEERAHSSELTSWEKWLLANSSKQRWEAAHGASTIAGYHRTEQAEVDQFLQDILTEYETNRYKDFIDYDFYSLCNIFKAYVVYEFYKKDKNDPITVFAYSFYEYVNKDYGGTINIGSSNEVDMAAELQAAYEALK